MKIIISLIGNSNVGKSTLFNKLTLSNCSLISEIAGTTIDYKYKLRHYKNKKFLFIDTIAYDIAINNKILHLFKKYILFSNIILFILNNNLGISYFDNKLYKYLLCYNKKILLVINKLDNNINNFSNEYWRLGIKKIIPISAYYNKGLNNLLENIYYYNIKKKKKIYININKKKKNKYINNITILGCPNVGKSSIFNSLINIERTIVSNIPGTTHDIIYNKLTINKNIFNIIDTAGINNNKKIINKIEKLSINRSLLLINKSDLIIFVIDVTKGVTNKDYYILNKIVKSGKSLIIIINKCDLIKYKDINNTKKYFLLKLKFINFSEIIFVSAKYKIGIKKIINVISNINKYLENIKITTYSLNKELKKIVTNNIIIFNKFKFKYINIAGYNPIKIIIHGKKLFLIPFNYKKYIEKYFYSLLPIKGIQIRIKYK